MSRAERRLARALRITPAADRDRYGSEWRGDLGSAAELGISPLEVARGATGRPGGYDFSTGEVPSLAPRGGRRATAASALLGCAVLARRVTRG